MSDEGTDVVMQMELRLLVPMQQALPLPVSLRYSRQDPYAVSIVFTGPGEEIIWVFARDLLAEGLDLPQGYGDVRIRPEHRDQRRYVMIGLTSPDGTAELEADDEQLREFVAVTEALVPRGHEDTVIDLDAALAGLLG